MISSASVLLTERSRAPSHDGQMRYASRLFFKHSHYNNGHKKHKRHIKHKSSSSIASVPIETEGFTRSFMCFMPFVLFVALVTFAIAASGDHAEAVLILGGLDEVADQ
jgi:hypothetical protein